MPSPTQTHVCNLPVPYTHSVLERDVSQDMRNYEYNGHITEIQQSWKRARPSLCSAKASSAAPTTHSCHFFIGSASPLNYSSQRNQNSKYVYI